MLLDPSARGMLGNPGLRCCWVWDKQGKFWQNKGFRGKDQQQESCNSAFFVKKTKQNNNPKHRTTQTFNRFVNHRHKRIKKYSKKIHRSRLLVLQGNWIQLRLADPHSGSGGTAVLTGTQTS